MVNRQIHYQISVIDDFISNKLYQNSIEYAKKALTLFPLNPAKPLLSHGKR